MHKITYPVCSTVTAKLTGTMYYSVSTQVSVVLVTVLLKQRTNIVTTVLHTVTGTPKMLTWEVILS